MHGTLDRPAARTMLRRWGIATVVVGYVALLLILVALGRHATLPEESAGIGQAAGPINAALQQTMGKPNPTDLLVDYASARALRDGVDPYAVTADLIDRIDAPPWPVMTANPHPPTTLVVLLPFSFLAYPEALAAWSLAMVFALVGTLLVLEVPWPYAVPLGVGLAITFPGAYGIGNVVPLIGLGIAIAYRHRDKPVVAAIGICVAAAPKSSGLVMVIPFLLTMRWRVVGWSTGVMALCAALPIMLYRSTWQRYLDDGARAIDLNAQRQDNASLLNLAAKIGLGRTMMLLLIIALACIAARLSHDLFWPTAWFSVAALPISWMYSMLTFMPLAIVAVRSRRTWPTSMVAASAALLLAAPPLGYWPTRVVPLINLFMYVVVLLQRESAFWPDWDGWRRLVSRLRSGSRAARSSAAAA